MIISQVDPMVFLPSTYDCLIAAVVYVVGNPVVSFLDEKIVVSRSFSMLANRPGGQHSGDSPPYPLGSCILVYGVLNIIRLSEYYSSVFERCHGGWE